MKAILAILITMLGLAQAIGQGTVSFANGATTKVINAVTGNPVESAEGIVAGLYYAPYGETQESAFTLLPMTNTISAGIFIVGRVEIPDYPPGSNVSLQVRAWELSYGPTYELAAAAPEMNGRRAFVGKSNIMLGFVGGGALPTPSLVTSFGLQGFAVDVAGGGPFLSINDIVVAEGTNGTIQAVFTVTLAGPSSQTISVDFETADGTALAGQDFVSTHGTLVYLPGELVQTVSVMLTADAPHEADETFEVRLSNPVNGAVLKASGRCLITEAVISDIRVDTVLSFHTVASRTYRVETTLDMTHWTTVADVAGTGRMMTVIHEGGGCNTLSMYRLRLLE